MTEQTKDPIQLAIDAISECLNDSDGHELNMSNYDHDDVCGLNNAYVSLFQTLEDVNGKLIALQSQPAAAHGVEGLDEAIAKGGVMEHNLSWGDRGGGHYWQARCCEQTTIGNGGPYNTAEEAQEAARKLCEEKKKND